MHRDPALAPRPAAAEMPIRFTGSGSEYFRIWIVNLFLTVLTLGIYSAWAKVRRLKYFYGNTLVADSPLDYHGTPKAILQGRVVAFLLLTAWNAVERFGSPAMFFGMLAVALAVLPWLLVRSLRFQFANTSYRGVRFGFSGKLQDAYLVFLLWPLLSIPTLSALVPFAHQRLRQFIQGGVRYGHVPGSMHAGPRAFYVVYAMTALRGARARQRKPRRPGATREPLGRTRAAMITGPRTQARRNACGACSRAKTEALAPRLYSLPSVQLTASSAASRTRKRRSSSRRKACTSTTSPI
jgi:hypothetical protein